MGADQSSQPAAVSERSTDEGTSTAVADTHLIREQQEAAALLQRSWRHHARDVRLAAMRRVKAAFIQRAYRTHTRLNAIRGGQAALIQKAYRIHAAGPVPGAGRWEVGRGGDSGKFQEMPTFQFGDRGVRARPFCTSLPGPDATHHPRI